MKRVTCPNDVPNEPHFAVIIYKSQSVYIEGDERSRTNPGHGYPAHTETYSTFEHYVTTDKIIRDQFIEKHLTDVKNMVCFDVSHKATITSKMNITIT